MSFSFLFFCMLITQKSLVSLIAQIIFLSNSMESKLISLISEIMSLDKTMNPQDLESKFISLITPIISLVSSMDLDSQPKPESEFISLFAQIVSLLHSMDFDSQPKPLSELISLTTQNISCARSRYLDSEPKPESDFLSLIAQTLNLEPAPELISHFHQLFSLVISMNIKGKKLISLCPQEKVIMKEGKLYVIEESPRSSNGKWACLPLDLMKFKLTGEEATHFLCRGCNGKNHEEFEKAQVNIKHPYHPKHSLQLVLFDEDSRTRKCYCCDEDLIGVFYYCSACDFAMNIACVEKPPLLAINDPKWHEHTLILFPRQDFLTCNVCALADSGSPIYMCLPCGFVVHLTCIRLPRVIKISRHLHCISFTPSFDQGDRSCAICRRKIDNDYGGYSCIRSSCWYAAHSKCATQKNVWDCKEVEGELEENEEEILTEPFVRIRDGIIQHFSHECHHLSLDDNSRRDYDDKKECRACILPVHLGDFYSCMECDFILHEACANLSRTIYHPMHPHVLTLVGGYDGVINTNNSCSACPWLCTGFFYQCDVEGCNYKLHVQCATTSEPLVHDTHMHPLFLTSKPGERRTCGVCKELNFSHQETFNCIQCDDFALCFTCATLPQRVKYTDDNHMLTLSYGEETSTIRYWCEICERELNPEKRFYRCNEYCCVTLHIECLLEWSLLEV